MTYLETLRKIAKDDYIAWARRFRPDQFKAFQAWESSPKTLPDLPVKTPAPVRRPVSSRPVTQVYIDPAKAAARREQVIAEVVAARQAQLMRESNAAQRAKVLGTLQNLGFTKADAVASTVDADWTQPAELILAGALRAFRA